MASKRVYISGPMRGLPDLNRAAFEKAAAIVREAGYAVVNPHEINGAWEIGMKDRGLELSGADYIERDLRELLHCNSILLLPGWENSVGARCELAVAFTLNLSVLTLIGFHGKLGETPPSAVTVLAGGYHVPPGPVLTAWDGNAIPSRDRVVDAVRTLDANLAGSLENGLAEVPAGAVVSAQWRDEDSETTQYLSRLDHLRTLLELAMAHLARGNAEATHAG